MNIVTRSVFTIDSENLINYPDQSYFGSPLTSTDPSTVKILDQNFLFRL